MSSPDRVGGDRSNLPPDRSDEQQFFLAPFRRGSKLKTRGMVFIVLVAEKFGLGKGSHIHRVACRSGHLDAFKGQGARAKGLV
jgi:hypothetical protein